MKKYERINYKHCKTCETMIGKILTERYKITQILSQGGFGRTFLALDTKMPEHNICVIKQLHPYSSEEYVLKKARELFIREGKTLQKLGEHPQIPRLLAYFEEDNQFYLVQEYIEGHTLTEELNQPLSQAEVLKILFDLLTVLEYVHEHHVIHRDIKPDNIIRRAKDNKLCLIDFGAVKEVSYQDSSLYSKTLIGSQGYIPLEQINGNPQYSSDIYALGMLCIQALTGRQPQELLTYMEEQLFALPNLVNIHPKLAELLRKMIKYNCNLRYSSGKEALIALKENFSNPDIYDRKGIKETTLMKDNHQLTKKNYIWMIGAGILALGLSIFALIKYNQSSIPSPQLPLNGTVIYGTLDETNSITTRTSLGIIGNIFNSENQQEHYYKTYYFSGEKGEKVIIEMNSEDLDSYLRINLPDGVELDANNDISPNNLDARLVVTLPEKGTYTVVVTSYEPQQVGNYQLSAIVKK